MVDMINLTTRSCRNCMVLIRIIVLKGLMENVRVFAKHVEGVKNGLADSLSGDKIDHFKLLCKRADKIIDKEPVGVPEAIWPIEKIWK